MKYYIIATIQRSGSHFLSHLLGYIEAGFPREIIKPIREGDMKTIHLKGKSTLRSKIWGATVHWSHWKVVLAKLREITSHQGDDFQMLNDTFPGLKFIYLYRLNKIKQSISWVKAEQTGQFSYPRNEKVKAGEYNKAKINNFLKRIVVDQAHWQNFFDTYNIRPHLVVYEELCANRVQVISGILDFLELPSNMDKPNSVPLDSVQTPIRQYDAVSEEWYRKFMQT